MLQCASEIEISSERNEKRIILILIFYLFKEMSGAGLVPSHRKKSGVHVSHHTRRATKYERKAFKGPKGLKALRAFLHTPGHVTMRRPSFKKLSSSMQKEILAKLPKKISNSKEHNELAQKARNEGWKIPSGYI